MEHLAKWLCLLMGLGLVFASVFSQNGGKAAQANAAEGVDLPIIMYHSILKDPAMTGTYVLPPDQLEEDLKYIKRAGYTPVLMKDIIAYVEEETAVLPEKPILITFDDGYYNNYLYVFPLMQKYQMKCVISIVGKFTDIIEPGEHQSPNYSHCSWEQLKEMSDSGLVEVQNHTYNLHSLDGQRQGARKCAGETVEEYRRLLQSDVGALQDLIREKVGAAPTTFTYPYGKYSDESEEILEEIGFKATLSVSPGVNHLTKGGSLSMLLRNNRAPGLSSDAFFKGLLK
ncbi:MAG: polysaccharide deacetylase family protein [Oscillospiraceae bacterium]|nr:polysaccharide deacetylase family protein [Oscillospiraceae bacterium]